MTKNLPIQNSKYTVCCFKIWWKYNCEPSTYTVQTVQSITWYHSWKQYDH